MAVADRWDAYNRRYKLGKYKPKPVRQTTTPYSGPPRPPNAALYPFPEFEDRSEKEWQELLDARVKPYETAIKKVNTQQLGQSEFQFEQAEAANQRLGQGFANLFTGGKAGEEGKQFAKENFGGEFLGMQAVAIAHQHLTQLTSDWNERDWAISTEYQKAMAEIPGLKEQMRESITRNDTDEYTRNFNIVNLMLDEAWNIYEANSKQYNTDQQLLAAKKMAAQQAGLKGYTDREDAVAEAAKWADDTSRVWTVVKNKDGSYSPHDTGKKKPKPPGSTSAGGSITAKNAALADAKWRTANGNTVWMAQLVKGVWTAVDTGKPKPKKPTTPKENTLNEREADLSMKVQTELRDDILGKPGVDSYGQPLAGGKRVGGMGYDEARAYLTRLALDALKGRPRAYIDGWVNSQLRVFFPQGTTDMRGGP